MRKSLFCITLLFFFLAIGPWAWGSDLKGNIHIAFLVDATGNKVFLELVQKEISTLLKNSYTVEFEVRTLDSSDREGMKRQIEQLMQDDRINCIIGLALDTSDALIGIKRYTKPVIAAAILDRKLQGLPMTAEGTSGIDNFNYIESPFDVEKDLTTFKRLYDYKHLAVLLNARETLLFHTVFSHIGRAVDKVSPGARLSFVEIYPHKLAESMAAMPDDVDSVYLPPVFVQDEVGEQKKLIDLINERRLPSFALLGEENVRMGVMASIAPDRNINAMSRRIAINVLKIFSGTNGADLPVQLSQYTDNYVVNVATLEKIDFFPSWQVMSEARLINLDNERRGRRINLPGVIGEALRSNVILQIEQLNTRLQQQEKNISSAPFFPQLELSTSVDMIDDNRVNAAVGSPSRHTWLASGSLSQILYADDVFANYAIQKIFLESQRFQEKAQMLDTVITAGEAYINLLFARSNRAIQNNNLAVTRKNLDIARNKEAVGSVGASEVHRWESELASNQINLNDAHRDLQLARLSVNNILNRPINEEFIAEDLDDSTPIELIITDPEVYGYLGDFKKLNRFGEFLMEEANLNLPELKQVAERVKAQKRDILNRQRAYYIPDIRIQGKIDHVLGEYDTVIETSSDLDTPWSIAATASWPLYKGGNRGYELEKSRIQLRQIGLEEVSLRNQLSLQVQSNLQTAAVSAREISLSRAGLKSAQKNFEITQAGYSEGRNSIADLIDAQNAKISAELGEAVAKYQFVLDFLKLERSVGRFHFLDTPQEKDAFLERLQRYMDATEENTH
ncbi:MAG: TolC family protein [Desulfopila sp.]|nr:TolC family protein [Desulfopila sp.]